jgi:SNF2 family DNA or RNA helicase
VAELHRQLAPHLLRRMKKDVLTQLPPKQEQIVRVELSQEQRLLYRTILERNYMALTGALSRQEAGGVGARMHSDVMHAPDRRIHALRIALFACVFTH